MPLLTPRVLFVVALSLGSASAFVAGCTTTNPVDVPLPEATPPDSAPVAVQPEGGDTMPPASRDAASVPEAAAADGSTCGFALSVDVSLAPVPATITGPDGLPAPLGAVRDGKGVTSLFIADELVVNGATAAEIVGLIARYSGSVLQHQDGDYLVKVDASQFPRTGAALDAAALNFCQPATASSEVMARLVAIWLHEARGGLSVALNGVDTPAFR